MDILIALAYDSNTNCRVNEIAPMSWETPRFAQLSTLLLPSSMDCDEMLVGAAGAGLNFQVLQPKVPGAAQINLLLTPHRQNTISFRHVAHPCQMC